MIERSTPSPIHNGLNREAKLANLSLQILQTKALLKSLYRQREAIMGQPLDRFHQEHSGCFSSGEPLRKNISVTGDY